MGRSEMFEWLEREIASIKTRRFHIVEGLVDAKMRKAVMESSLPLPSSYKEFIFEVRKRKIISNRAYKVSHRHICRADRENLEGWNVHLPSRLL